MTWYSSFDEDAPPEGRGVGRLHSTFSASTNSCHPERSVSGAEGSGRYKRLRWNARKTTAIGQTLRQAQGDRSIFVCSATGTGVCTAPVAARGFRIAPLCKGSCQRQLTEGLEPESSQCASIIRHIVPPTPPSRLTASHLPLHRGGIGRSASFSARRLRRAASG